MKRSKLSELEAGRRYSVLAQVRDLSVSVGRTGKPYVILSLIDSTGRLEARVWDRVDELQALIKDGMPMELELEVNSYKGSLQAVVRDAKELQWDDSVRAAIIPTGQLAGDVALMQLQELVLEIQDPGIKELLAAIMDDENLMRRLKSAPAAKMIHHAWMGGLLEHTLSMAQLAKMVYCHYQEQFPGMVDMDLLLAGVILHDLGKTREYDEMAGMDFTFSGRMLGHMGLALDYLACKARSCPQLEEDKYHRLIHSLLAHHGDFDKGSPVRPATPEAMLIHLIDMMDSQMAAVARLMGTVQPDGWSEWTRNFDRRFYFGPRGRTNVQETPDLMPMEEQCDDPPPPMDDDFPGEPDVLTQQPEPEEQGNSGPAKPKGLF